MDPQGFQFESGAFRNKRGSGLRKLGVGMQACDSTCQHCARHFFKFYKQRMLSAQRHAGRSGEGDFGLAAATSVRPPREKDGGE